MTSLGAFPCRYAVEMGQRARDLRDRIAAEEARLRQEIKARNAEIALLNLAIAVRSCGYEDAVSPRHMEAKNPGLTKLLADSKPKETP